MAAGEQHSLDQLIDRTGLTDRSCSRKLVRWKWPDGWVVCPVAVLSGF
jgi:hypothetical protein